MIQYRAGQYLVTNQTMGPNYDVMQETVQASLGFFFASQESTTVTYSYVFSSLNFASHVKSNLFGNFQVKLFQGQKLTRTRFI